MGFLHGKRALIVGIASQRSIAWGIANAMHREGAQLAFTYQNERLKDRVDEAANAFGSNIVLPCDVAQDGQIEQMYAELGKHWDGFDILVHSVGFAPREALQGQYLDNLTRENFTIAHDISSYSLAALAKAGRPMMAGRGGAILTLTYLGAERALNNYNVMGLAKASLEANVRYLAFNLGPEGAQCLRRIGFQSQQSRARFKPRNRLHVSPRLWRPIPAGHRLIFRLIVYNPRKTWMRGRGLMLV